MERWAGRVALVTGASVGIGAAICQMLCKHGVKVIGCARRVDKIEKMKEDGLENLHAYKVIFGLFWSILVYFWFLL